MHLHELYIEDVRSYFPRHTGILLYFREKPTNTYSKTF